MKSISILSIRSIVRSPPSLVNDIRFEGRTPPPVRGAERRNYVKLVSHSFGVRIFAILTTFQPLRKTPLVFLRMRIYA